MGKILGHYPLLQCYIVFASVIVATVRSAECKGKIQKSPLQFVLYVFYWSSKISYFSVISDLKCYSLSCPPHIAKSGPTIYTYEDRQKCLEEFWAKNETERQQTLCTPGSCKTFRDSCSDFLYYVLTIHDTSFVYRYQPWIENGAKRTM